MPPSSVEVEIKLPAPNLRTLRARLRRAGFRLHHPREFEANTLLDTTPSTLRPSGQILRLRQFGPTAVVTYKGRGQANRHKVREELEFRPDNLDHAAAVFARLGFTPTFRYEKFRTEYSDATGIATIDETPIGNFLELEGAPEWIDRAAVQLGYSDRDYITKSYGGLYLEHCQSHAVEPTHMVFSKTTHGTALKTP